MDNVILKIVAEVYGLTVSDLLMKNKTGLQPEARRMFCYFYKKPKTTNKEICYAINQSRVNIYKGLKKIAFEITTYKDTNKRFETTKNKMIQYLIKTKKELESWLANNPHQDQQEREKRLERLADVNETYEYIINL